MVFKIAKTPLKGKKKKYALWVLLTCVSRSLNRCKRLEMNPITLGRENSKKLPKKCKIRIWQNFASFWTFSLSGMIGLISSLLHLFRLLETQVQSTHKAYFEEIFIWPFKGVLAILKAKLLCGGAYLRIVLYDFPFYYLYRHTKAGG